MDYKKIAVVFVGACFLAAVGAADVNAKTKSAQAVQKAATKLLKKQSKGKNKNQVTLKSGPLGGINIVTDGKKTQADKQKEADANKKKNAAPAAAQSGLIKKDGKIYFSGTELPEDYQSISIFGEAEAGKAQAAALIKANNPQVKLACSVEELVDLYWQEAERENIRPDLALAQSIVETGSYRYGGDVQHHQNNFCGLGTTGGGVSGASFKTPEIGVRAHIQHLLAYTQKRRPKTDIVDPRYELAHNIRLERGVVDTWYGLNGTWAMGSLYCEKIMATYQKMLAMQAEEPKDKDEAKREDKKSRKEKDKSAQKRGSVRERIEKILKDKNNLSAKK